MLPLPNHAELLIELSCALTVQAHAIRLVSIEHSLQSVLRLHAINQTIDELTAQLSVKNVLNAA